MRLFLSLYHCFFLCIGIKSRFANYFFTKALSPVSLSTRPRNHRPSKSACAHASTKSQGVIITDDNTKRNCNMSSDTVIVDKKENAHYFISPFLSSLYQNEASSSSSSSHSEDNKSTRIALVVLNSPIKCPPSPIFESLWKISSLRVCADGGANRLFDATLDPINMRECSPSDEVMDENLNRYVPDIIRGDLDSLKPNVRSYYESQGCLVQEDPDQNTNDLDKALQKIKDTADASKRQDDNGDNNIGIKVFVYGAFGGRFDQEMGAIQALYKWSAAFQNQLFLYDDQTCAFLLPPKIKSEIRLAFFGEHPANEEDDKGPDIFGEGPTCGLIPIGCRCDDVKTTGFKWNLDGSLPLEFGGLVSTSNRAMEKIITVQSSSVPLIFTAEVTTA